MAGAIVRAAGPVLTNTQKEILAPENEIQICSGQLDTFDPSWNERRGNNVFYHCSLSIESTLTKSV